MWSIHTMEYYSAIKRNEALTQATMWMNLENMMLSERSQPKATYYTTPFIYMKCPENVSVSVHRDRNQAGGCQGLGGMGSDSQRIQSFLLE